MTEYRINKHPNSPASGAVAAGLLIGSISLLLGAVVPNLAILPADFVLLSGACALLAAMFDAPVLVRRVVVGGFGGIVAANMFWLLLVIATRTRPAGTIILLLAMHVWPILTSVRWLQLNRRQTAASAPLRIRRTTSRRVIIGFLGKLLVAAVLVESYDYPGREQAGWTASDLGIMSPIDAPIGFALGLAGSVPYLAFLAVLPRGRRATQIASRRADLAVLGQNVPRGRCWRILHSFNLVVFGSILEELVYRGFFVYLLGGLIGNVAVALSIGLALCLCVHLYQGVHLLGRHIAFYVIVVTLLYSPFGLGGAIGFHIGCNFLYMMNLNAVVRYYCSHRNDRGRVEPAQVEERAAASP